MRRGELILNEKKPLKWFVTPGLMTGPYAGFRRNWWKAVIFWLMVGALAYAAGLYWESMQFARINNAPHTSAKIIRTWETVQRNGKKVKMARIAFTVIDGEKSIECEQSIPTEHLPSDLQQVGAEIDIVPNGPSCFGSIVPVLFYQTHSRP
jgi:hypothetical protein